MAESKQVVNENDVEWQEGGQGPFMVRRRALAHAAGGRHLGCCLYEVQPGKRLFPYHYHFANEEAMYVLRGEGV